MSQPAQQQDVPGSQQKMSPAPDCGEESYQGSGRLTGKVAVITGGDSGIGRAVAIAYAREGADVLIAYLSEEEDATDTAKLVAGRCWSPGTCPIHNTAATLSPRQWRSSARSTSWSTTPPTR